MLLLKEVTLIFDRIRDGFSKLRKLDRKFQVFGSSQHQYRSTPLLLNALEDFERSIGVILPTGYREFLLQIGFGCGPYYGVWSPTEVLTEVESLFFEEGENCAFLSDPFPLKEVTTEIQKHDWPSGGCIPIGHQGCTFWSVLVLEGAFRGRVWDVACYVGIDGEWLPARRPTGRIDFKNSAPKELPSLTEPPEFVEWVDGWVTRCLVDLNGR